MDTTIAPWLYLVGLLGHFLYQTFDAIDGKQARRTGTSSPLGQLFDHGCDAFITNVVGIFNASCMQYVPRERSEHKEDARLRRWKWGGREEGLAPGLIGLRCGGSGS
jgi:hypothetical protein